MHRPIIYDQAQGRDYDILHGAREALYALGQATEDLLGSTLTVVVGLGATQTISPSLTLNIAAGDIYQLAAVDTTAYGSLGSDATQTMQQGFAAAQTVLLTTSGLSSGQSRYALISAAFSQVDEIPSDDPNSGILNYLNASNPSGSPWSGPNNSGAAQNTRRKGVCTISVTYGAAATTGSEVPPNAPGGSVGLFLVDLAFGQTTVTNAQILVAGPSVGSNVPSNYPAAPFLAGLGQKPTYGANAGNPNGVVAGTAGGIGGTIKAPNFVWDTTNNTIWACITTGSPTTAVWLQQSAQTVVGSSRGLTGSSAGGVKTATWAAKELVAVAALGGSAVKGANLSLSFNGATTGAGGMDIGATPVSTDLSVYVIFNPLSNTWSTLGVAGGTSNGPVYSGTHMPTGYTHSALIWAGVTDGSGNFTQWQQIDRRIAVPPGPTANSPFNTFATGLSATVYTSLSLSSVVPAIATEWTPFLVNNASGGAFAFSPVSTGNVGVVTGGFDTGFGRGLARAMIATAQTVFYKVTGGSWGVGLIDYAF